MKRIDAVIKPAQLEQVKERLTALGATGLTVYEVKGFGRQKGHTEMYRGSEYVVDFLPKLKIDLVVKDEIAPAAFEAIMVKAHTGKIGDGKIFVSTLDDVIRVRTREHGNDAI